MKADQLARLESQQTSIGKKVLTFVPYDSVVNAAQVLNRMRPTGLTPSINVVQGCLGSLAHVGLLKEPDRGFFIRIAPKDQPMPKPQMPATKALDNFVRREAAKLQAEVDERTAPRIESKTVEEKGEDFITRIGSITSDMRANGKELIDMADELDEFILSLSGQLDKLNQLKKMFKDFQ